MARNKPDSPDVHKNLGYVLLRQGKTDEGIACLKRSLELKPDDEIEFCLATILPVIYQSVEHIHSCRDKLVDKLSALLRAGTRFAPDADTIHTVFFLPYQGQNDRDIQQTIGKLFTPPKPITRKAAPPAGGSGVIRLGFLSLNLRRHTVAKLCRGLISQLSRESFEVTALSVGDHFDEIAKWIKDKADRYVVVPFDLQAAADAVSSENLDVLVYPDIGMEPLTYSLGRLRLAPVQCVTWGHPVTTGMPTIDYFISSDLLELPHAQEHYTEMLVRLKSLPTYYFRPNLSGRLGTRDSFGFAEDDHIYLCPQSLFKLHPDFDQPLAGILRRDPKGRVVFIQGHYTHWAELLLERFRSTIGDASERILFLPRQPEEDFFRLMTVADVLLDPFHFGGGNSTYEAMAVGTPIVTFPTEFMRGRVTYACYKKMGVLDCVANDPDHYVDIAVKLGTDKEYRETIRSKILGSCDVLFEDAEAVRELEEFVREAVERARHNRHTARGE
jgi:predicted O-linked N-acetylglucosamine transferase (SPINDLY family)